MSKVSVRTYKSMRGIWRSESKIMLDDVHQLDILTMKRSNGKVASTATVGKLEGSFVSHAVHQDYYKYITEKAFGRVTEKAVAEMHNAIDFDSLIAESKSFYGIA